MNEEIDKRVEKAIHNLKTNWKDYYRKLERYYRNNGEEDLKTYLKEAIRVFDTHDQGSLSFTETRLLQRGFDYPFAILESIESKLARK